MRRELAALPAQKEPLFVAHTALRSAEHLVWRRLIPKVRLGSHSWHLLQEMFARRSSLGADLRMRCWFYENTLLDCGTELCVFPDCIMHYPANIRLGVNVFINRGVIITAPAPVHIGRNALIGPYVVINSGNHLYRDSGRPIRTQGHEIKPIHIGEDVWLGAHVVVLPGVTIHEGAVVAAGAVVSGDVPTRAVVAGVPARTIGERAPL